MTFSKENALDALLSGIETRPLMSSISKAQKRLGIHPGKIVASMAKILYLQILPNDYKRLGINRVTEPNRNICDNIHFTDPLFSADWTKKEENYHVLKLQVLHSSDLKVYVMAYSFL